MHNAMLMGMRKTSPPVSHFKVASESDAKHIRASASASCEPLISLCGDGMKFGFWEITIPVTEYSGDCKHLYRSPVS